MQSCDRAGVALLSWARLLAAAADPGPFELSVCSALTYWERDMDAFLVE